jgi:hypothetical protein
MFERRIMLILRPATAHPNIFYACTLNFIATREELTWGRLIATRRRTVLRLLNIFAVREDVQES